MHLARFEMQVALALRSQLVIESRLLQTAHASGIHISTLACIRTLKAQELLKKLAPETAHYGEGPQKARTAPDAARAQRLAVAATCNRLHKCVSISSDECEAMRVDEMRTSLARQRLSFAVVIARGDCKGLANSLYSRAARKAFRSQRVRRFAKCTLRATRVFTVSAFAPFECRRRLRV